MKPRFNPNRLEIARKRRKLTKKSLAESLGVSQQTINRWSLSQKEEPRHESLVLLSNLLEFPIEFFFGQDIQEPEKQTTSFRSQKSMSATVRDAALAAGAIGFSIYDWVEKLFDLPKCEIPDLSNYEPEIAARVLRQEWNLGEKPISNMIHLLESKGVRVFSLAENTIKVNAYSLWKNGTPFVFLNTIKSAECSRMDAAHELGHLVLHQDCKMSGREAEDQANNFGASFLLPKSDVIAHIPRVRHINELIQLKHRWKVSLAALNYRLHKIGIISDWKNRDFCIEIATRGFNKIEPRPSERETSILWKKVIQMLWSDGKTHEDIASELNLPVSEVTELIFGIISAQNTKNSSTDYLSLVK